MKLFEKSNDELIWPSHSARSAWIETIMEPSLQSSFIGRTPQGVRGLKLDRKDGAINYIPSHSARSAWIETS